MPLAAVTDDCNALGLYQAGVAVFFVIDVGHEVSLSVISTEMTSICLRSCLTICSARAGLHRATIVMRDRPGSESGTTISRSMLYPRELNRPVMLNKTPKRFSTRIVNVNVGSSSIKSYLPTDR